MSYDFVDLFAGAGGWDLAARSFGRKVLGFELWEPANDTRAAAGLETQAGDVLSWNPTHRAFEAKGLIASPPCQTFSMAGKGSGRAQVALLAAAVTDWRFVLDSPCSERTALVLEPLRWIVDNYKTSRPYRSVLLEQVPQVQPIWDAYAVELEKLGYSVWTGILSTENFSVPQTRKRAILLASTDKTMNEPPATCFPNKRMSWAEGLGWKPSDHPNAVLESNYKGGGRNEITGKWNLGTRKRNEPSFTITGKPHKIIYVPGEKAMRMNPAQMGMLQTFPADWPWQGTLSDQNLQAGNAIPVNFAEALLEHVL